MNSSKQDRGTRWGAVNPWARRGFCTGQLINCCARRPASRPPAIPVTDDLKGSLGRDTERARSLLAKLIGQVTLRRDGQRLVAELQGNLSGLLELDNQPLYKGGSGDPLLSIPVRRVLVA